MTLRPLNTCLLCQNTWYPRGDDLSSRCPHCGSEHVKVAPPPPGFPWWMPQSGSFGGCISWVFIVVTVTICWYIFKPPLPWNLPAKAPEQKAKQAK
jgi:hypothetical protein